MEKVDMNRNKNQKNNTINFLMMKDQKSEFRTTSTYNLRTRLAFKQHDTILIKEQPMLTKIVSSLEKENM